MHLTPAQVLTMTFHFVLFRPAKGWQPRNLLQVRDVLRVMLISCRAGYENPASCHPGFRRLKDFGQAIHQLQPGHVSRRTFISVLSCRVLVPVFQHVSAVSMFIFDWIQIAQCLGYEAACAKIPRGRLTRPPSPVNFHANVRVLA